VSEMAETLEMIGLALLGMLVFGVWFLVMGATATVAIRLRHTPGEMLQLRLFQNHRKLPLAIVIVGIGVASTFLHIIPYVVGLIPPVAWHNALILVQSVFMTIGFVWLARIFWIPTHPKSETN